MSLTKLIVLGAAGWAGWRLYQAHQLGVPYEMALSKFGSSVPEIKAQLNAAAQARASAMAPPYPGAALPMRPDFYYPNGQPGYYLR